MSINSILENVTVTMNKEIYFCVDRESMNMCCWGYGYCPTTYYDTEDYIKEGLSPIFTNSIAHLSFDLLELDYDIYLCYKKKKVKIDPHMDLHGTGGPCKDIRRTHNLFKLFRGGIFNELLGIKQQ